MPALPSFEPLLPAIFAHAREILPRECCGLIVQTVAGLVYWPCRNLSDRRDHFVLDPADQVAASRVGTLCCIVHSHVEASPVPAPGAYDLGACRQSGLPWLIVAVGGEFDGQYHWLDAAEPMPLEGRRFVWGAQDCVSLVRDYFQAQGVSLPDLPRGPYGWWHTGGDFLREGIGRWNLAEAALETIRPHDIVIMRIGATVPNHMAVYVGGNRILHQMESGVSGYGVFGRYYRERTALMLRLC